MSNTCGSPMLKMNEEPEIAGSSQFKSWCKNRAYEIYRSKLRTGAVTIQLQIAKMRQLIER